MQRLHEIHLFRHVSVHLYRRLVKNCRLHTNSYNIWTYSANKCRITNLRVSYKDKSSKAIRQTWKAARSKEGRGYSARLSNLSLASMTLTFDLVTPKAIGSCPMDHLCQFASKSVHSKYCVHKFGNRRTDGRTDGHNVYTPAGLVWRRHKNKDHNFSAKIREIVCKWTGHIT